MVSVDKPQSEDSENNEVRKIGERKDGGGKRRGIEE